MAKTIANSARRSTRRSKGQAMTEFMFVMIPAMIVLFVAIQFAVIARDGTALGQFASQAARWAAAPANSGADCTALLNNYYQGGQSTGLPLPVAMIANANGISCGGSSTTASNGVVLTMNCPGVTNCTLRSQGSQVQVVVTMSIANDLFLGQAFLGVLFPGSLSNQSSAFTQG